MCKVREQILTCTVHIAEIKNVGFRLRPTSAEGLDPLPGCDVDHVPSHLLTIHSSGGQRLLSSPPGEMSSQCCDTNN